MSQNRHVTACRTHSVALSLLTSLFVFVAVSVEAQTPTVIHNFPAYNGDLCTSEGALVQGRDGYMYGTRGRGLRIEWNSRGLQDFAGRGGKIVISAFPTGWAACDSGLTLGNDGNFYGTCQSGNLDQSRRHLPVDSSWSIHRSA